jgi:uncharacterized protein YaiI (UPF0178 family)
LDFIFVPGADALSSALIIYVDADGCAVKEEIYKLARRHQIKVILVANQYLNIPFEPIIEMRVVSGGFDAADDWIAENIERSDILITSDLLLADRCIQRGARVVGPKGRELDSENIGSALAIRSLNSHLRDLGHKNTGPKAMEKENRSQFLSTMDLVIHRCLREKK